MRESRRQVITGTVVSDRMDKTITVQVETVKQHPKYKKYIKRRKKYKVHDETNECRLGDIVRCMETRPISKDKRWRVDEILRRKFVSIQEIEETDELVMKKEVPDFQVEAKEEAEVQAEAPAEEAGDQAEPETSDETAEAEKTEE